MKSSESALPLSMAGNGVPPALQIGGWMAIAIVFERPATGDIGMLYGSAGTHGVKS